MEAREAAAQDWSAIAASWQGDLEVIRHHFEHSGPQSTLILAWQGATPVGMGVLRPHYDGPHGLAAHPRAAELAHLWVSPDARGLGAGSALITAAETLAARRGHPELALGVDADNEGAARLYARLGYARSAQFDTSTYDYRDANGQRQTATEHNELLVKPLTQPATL